MTDLSDGPGRPIGKVRAGMRVVDAEGEMVGTVTQVTVGDRPAGGGIRPDREADGWAAGVLGRDAPDLEHRQAERLMAGGYLRVIGTGVHGVDRYVAADQISEVDDPTVFLRVGRDQLMAEQ
ncbi:hypothetical protein ACN28C_31250 [Plantactinospora sp. WMMC1484]|uniref:hypothetical protein n=1 Tax=Plantactinospora sp. WMMC1484 TaxID=3404122 RepID=UPI003BF4C321